MQRKLLYGGSVHVPGQGFVIFGGLDSNLTNAQQLRSLDGQWELGPSIFEGQPDYSQCLVQVNSDFDHNIHVKAKKGLLVFQRGVFFFSFRVVISVDSDH